MKSHLQTSVLHSSDNSRVGHPEYLLLDVCINRTHVLIAVYYRPPDLSYLLLAEFEQVFMDFLARYRHVIVMGDFNSNLLTQTNEQVYLTNTLFSCNLTILPLHATHHTATTDTWLDIMAVADPDLVVNHGQQSVSGLSRHDLVFCVYRLSTPRSKSTFIQYRNLVFDYNILLHEAQTVPWCNVLLEDNVDVMVSVFNRLVTGLLDKHAPIVKKRVTKNPAPWLTDHIRNLQNQRDYAFQRAKRTKRPEDWVTYKMLRNSTKQQIRNSKVRFYYQSFSGKLSTRTVWSKVKELGIGKTKAEHQVHIDLNVINDFFVNTPIDLSGAHDYTSELCAAPIYCPFPQFAFSPVTEADVFKAIMRVSSNAVGADKIPIQFLKIILPFVLPALTAIFNKSLSTSTFPSAWKLAIVRPLQKSSCPQSPSDFRPISILPALSKCLERLVHQQWFSHIKTNNILSSYQSGFRSNHSTTSALLKITDDIRHAMDKTQITVLTLFDFSKAFDSVFHPLLFIKLLKCGFSAGCVNWVRSYLSGREQCVKSGNQESAWKPVIRGVPQGSVLGPLLFSLYINNVTAQLLFSKFHLYADDLQIYISFPSSLIETAISNMNEDIAAIASWAFKHGLKLNESKTQTLLIGSNRLISNIDMDMVPRLRLNGHPLEFQNKVKNLGLIMNNNLTWTDQVTATCNKVFASIHSLKRFAIYFPLNMKVMLVKTLVFPHFNYCDTVYNDMTAELSDRLQRAQNYCIRFVFNLKRNDHVTPFYQELAILKLKVLRQYHILMVLHDVLHKHSPQYLYDRFAFISNNGAHNTRHGSNLLIMPAHRSSFYNKSFTVSAIRLWNSLPASIRSINLHARFGAEVKDFLYRGLGDRG